MIQRDNPVCRFLRQFVIDFRREIVDSEFSVSTFLDSCCYLFVEVAAKILEVRDMRRAGSVSSTDLSLSPLPIRQAVWLKLRHYARGREGRVARLITRKYSLKLVYQHFPFDTFWRDYFQLQDFIPLHAVMVDVGATIGDVTLILAKHYGSETVIAIEPDRDAFELLTRNIAINDLAHVVLAFNFAAWESDGHVFLARCQDGVRIMGNGQIRAYSSKTLDSIMREVGLQADLLKIDAEGCELSVLRGAKQILKDSTPRIIIEVHSASLRKGVLDYLRSLGYVLIHEKVVDVREVSVLYLSPVIFPQS